MGWNNMVFLGANNTDVNTAIAWPCLGLPVGNTARAFWHFNATTQSWSRNLYFPDGTSSVQIMTVNFAETFWILVGP